MEISSVSSSLQNTVTVQSQNQALKAKEMENDGDKDDVMSNVTTQRAEASAAPRPTVNASGQAVGTVINTQA